MASTYDAHATDPPLLQEHSSFIEVATRDFTYPSVRVFFKRHEQQDQMPAGPVPLPLLVFIHGLGGSVSQFTPLLTRLSSCASCLALDLPGCGRSSFAPETWAAYSYECLLNLLEAVIAQYRQPGQGLVLIGHSMGCSLAASLVSRRASLCAINPLETDSPYAGIVAICPPAGLRDKSRIALFKALLWIPTPVFDLIRAWDSRGGPDSGSVRRFVGEDADEESKLLQLRFNHQSKTPVWRRMAWGCLPVFDSSGKQVGGLAGEDAWKQVADLPVCLIAGDADRVAPPSGAEKIASLLQSSHTPAPSAADTRLPPDIVSPSTPSASAIQPTAEQAPAVSCSLGEPRASTQAEHQDAARDGIFSEPADATPAMVVPPVRCHPARYVEYHLLPYPASHGLLYVPATIGVVAGIVANFLARHVSGQLDRGWQLRFLSREGKWDVKNLQKWSKVQPVSRPIAGIFYAMKTLRQIDDTHSPHCFVKAWSGVVKDVIDISHDHPVYDPRDLESGGIHYHKFPTVSKIPPTDSEVGLFNSVVDKIRGGHSRAGQQSDNGSVGKGHFIGVHCHYGFNRTGYFIVCYLVDRCGYTLRDAIETFSAARPVGIRHSHFLDAISLRYARVVDVE